MKHTKTHDKEYVAKTKKKNKEYVAKTKKYGDYKALVGH
jgi:hypothetical protein